MIGAEYGLNMTGRVVDNGPANRYHCAGWMLIFPSCRVNDDNIMKMFISGGCKNGKSHYAQTLAYQMRPDTVPLYYLATMIPVDAEDDRRIEAHRQEREGWGFETIEITRDILTATGDCQWNGSFLLDSVTALLANEMFDKNGTVIPNAAQKVAEDLTALAKKTDHIVFVSDDIHSDARFYDAVTEEYRKGLAFIGRKLAAICDTVLELSAGRIITHWGLGTGDWEFGKTPHFPSPPTPVPSPQPPVP